MSEAGEKERASREAADWLARLNSRHVPIDVLKRFYDWRRDPSNAAAFSQLEEIWQSSQRLGADPDVARAVESVLDRDRARYAFTAFLRAPKVRWAAVLAAIAIVVGAALFWCFTPTRFTTGIGEHRMIILADGTHMHLNTNTVVEVSPFAATRQIGLTRGEAYFEVAHDAARPFVLHVAGLDIRDVGTRFDVRSDQGAARVALIEGVVDVTQKAGDGLPTRLRAGQLLVALGDRPAMVQDADVTSLLAWTQGRIMFRDASLPEAVAEMNRYNALPIELRTSRLATARVNGTFEMGNSADFASAMAALYALRVARAADGHIILGD